MTLERIAEIKARADAATPGPWNDAWRGMVMDDHGVIATDIGFSNAKFIAASRIDVPDLIAALEVAQRERDEARAAIERVRALLDGAWSMATPTYAVRAALDPQPEDKK